MFPEITKLLLLHDYICFLTVISKMLYICPENVWKSTASEVSLKYLIALKKCLKSK